MSMLLFQSLVVSASVTCIDLVANSTPMVDLDSKLNSFLVNLESKFDFPTPESPIKTTEMCTFYLLFGIKLKQQKLKLLTDDCPHYL